MSDDIINPFFEEFIHLRQHGTNRDDAWYQVLAKAEQNHAQDQDIKRLLAKATTWERQEGHKFQYRSRRELNVTQINPTETGEVLTAPPDKAAPPRPAMTGELNPAALRAYEQQRLAQILDAPTKPVTQMLNKPTVEHPPEYFTEKTRLLIYARGYPQPLEIYFKNEVEQLIGRETPGAAMNPQIDLNPFGAGMIGVSRMHAAMMLQGNTLLLTDIGSTNGTFLNGKPLVPQEIYAVKDQDKVRFGQLECRLRFYHGE